MILYYNYFNKFMIFSDGETKCKFFKLLFNLFHLCDQLLFYY